LRQIQDSRLGVLDSLSLGPEQPDEKHRHLLDNSGVMVVAYTVKGIDTGGF
jgi:hypothetical protein